jgi:hypothetical protein
MVLMLTLGTLHCRPPPGWAGPPVETLDCIVLPVGTEDKGSAYATGALQPFTLRPGLSPSGGVQGHDQAGAEGWVMHSRCKRTAVQPIRPEANMSGSSLHGWPMRFATQT